MSLKGGAPGSVAIACATSRSGGSTSGGVSGNRSLYSCNTETADVTGAQDCFLHASAA